MTVASQQAACSADDVMQQLRRPTIRPRWQPEIVSMQGPGTLHEGDVQEGRAHMLGFDVQGKSTAVRIEERCFEEDVVVGVRMKLTYELVPSAQGVVVTHRLEAELPRGPLGRLLSVFLRRRLKRMQETSLEGLVRQAEGDGAG